MSVELLYTSAPQGLKQGSRGFSTVLCTAGLPVNLATRLEGLSGYRHVFPPTHAQASSNPVCYSHLRFVVGGKPISILSRIADYGIDYSQRTNKLAHHVVLEPTEQPAAGPAWLLSQPGVMRSSWNGVCQTLATGPALPRGDQPVAICHTWNSIMGDAGWGGVVADAFASHNAKPLWIVYRLEQSGQLLKLIDEAIALLPAQDRWRATFSTYVTNLPPEADCKVRCVLEASEEARVAAARGTLVNIASPSAVTSDSIFVNVARSGAIDIVASAVSRRSLSEKEQNDDLPTGDDGTIVEEESKAAPPSVPLRLSRPSPPSRFSRTQQVSMPVLNTQKSFKYGWPAFGAIVIVALMLASTTYFIYLKSVETNPKQQIATQGQQDIQKTQTPNPDAESSPENGTPQQSSSGDTKQNEPQIIEGQQLSNDQSSKELQSNEGEIGTEKTKLGHSQADEKNAEQKANESQNNSEASNAKNPEESDKTKSEHDQSSPCYVELERLLEGSFCATGEFDLPVKKLGRLWINVENSKSNKIQWGPPRKLQDENARGPEERKGDIKKWHVKGTRMTITLSLTSEDFVKVAQKAKADFAALGTSIAEFNSSAKRLVDSLTQQTNVPGLLQAQIAIQLPPIDRKKCIEQVKDIDNDQSVHTIRDQFVVIGKALETALNSLPKDKDKGRDKLKSDWDKLRSDLDKLKGMLDMTVKSGHQLNASFNEVCLLAYSRDDLIKVAPATSGLLSENDAVAVPLRFRFQFQKR